MINPEGSRHRYMPQKDRSAGTELLRRRATGSTRSPLNLLAGEQVDRAYEWSGETMNLDNNMERSRIDLLTSRISNGY